MPKNEIPVYVITQEGGRLKLQPIRAWLFRIIGAILMLTSMIWPAIWNKTPFFFPDTYGYYLRAEKSVAVLSRLHRFPASATDGKGIALSDKSDGGQDLPKPGLGDSAAIPPTVHFLVTGRSVYYGALLYLGQLSGFFWLTVLIQASALLVAIALVLSLLSFDIWPNLFWIALLLSLLSDASFFTSFLMPDIFVAISILVAATLVSVEQTLTKQQSLVACVLLVLGLLFHDSTLPIVALMVCLRLLWRLSCRKRIVVAPLGLILSACALSILGKAAFDVASSRIGHVPVIRPPLLSARLIEDGPGTTFLRKDCPDSGVELCKFEHLFPISSEIFLWKVWRPYSISNSLTNLSMDQQATETIQISQQDIRFAWKVFRAEPAAVTGHALANGVRQVFCDSLEEFDYDVLPRYQPDFNYRQVFDNSLPAPWLIPLHESLAYRGLIPVRMLSRLNYLSSAVAALYLAAIGLVPRFRPAMSGKMKGVVCMALAGVGFNGLICGAIPGVFPRYGARVIWFLPLFALMSFILGHRNLRPDAVEEATIVG